MRSVGRLSQAIAEGDAISVLVEVEDAASAERAQQHGADGLVAARGAGAVRAASQLPLLHRGDSATASEAGADAVLVAPEPGAWDEAYALGLECVVRVANPEQLEEALELLDPEVVLLASEPDADEDALAALLSLLHDVPAGKLAIAELHDATADDVAELERAGVDAVLVAAVDVASLIPDDPPAV